MNNRYVAAVDLGSTKIALGVARITGDNVQVIHYKEYPSDGIRYSYVYNPLRASAVLKQAINEAEDALNIKINRIVTGLPKWFVKQEVRSAEIPRSEEKSCITHEEVRNLRNIAIDNYPLEDPENQYVYGTTAQSFSVGRLIQGREDDVVGMVSKKITGAFRVFVGNRDNVDNLERVALEAGVDIAEMRFSPEATAQSVLSSNEKENGVGLIDLGGGVSSLMVYQNGMLVHYSSIPFGGKSITTDIRYECNITPKLAENIKLGFGVCMPDRLPSHGDKIIHISYGDGNMEKQLPVKYLSEIITRRQKEIFDALLWQLQESGWADSLRSGVVISGGGSNLTNCANYLKEISGYNVRVGYPLRQFSADGCKGVFETSASTCMGLLMGCKDAEWLESANRENEIETIADTANIQEQEIPAGEIFSADAFEKREKKEKEHKETPAKKPRTPKRKTIFAKWGEQVGTLFDSGYDGMENSDDNL